MKLRDVKPWNEREMSARDNEILELHRNGSARFILNVNESGVRDEEWCTKWRATHIHVVNS